MKHVIGTMGFVAIAAWFAAPGVAMAAHDPIGDIENGRKIFLEGKGDDVPACASCHQPDGLGDDSMGTPRVAYQVSTYLLKQLTDFATGKRRDNTMFQMNDIAKALTPQERKDVSAYIHSLKSPYIGSDLDQLREDGVDVGNPALGKMIVEYGAPDHGVPACKSCHGFHGRSAGRVYPAIGGQKYVYLKHELEAFREGAKVSEADIAAGNFPDEARVNDPMAQMRKVAMHMTDEDIANVAAFLTNAEMVTPGNRRAPPRP